MHYFTAKDQLRLDTIAKYLEGSIYKDDALRVLEIKERQFRRLVARFKQKGMLSIKHGNSGRRPVNKVSKSLEDKIVYLYKNKYRGFNLSHFREKLGEELPRNSSPSYSTLRRIMQEHSLLSKRRPRYKKVHRLRNRYEKEGLFVQIDGSHHRWFGERKSCLIAIIDDATGKILSARFSPTETTLDTLKVTEDAIQKYGRFHIIYSDKAGIFGDGKRSNFTNFKRAMKQLDILPVLAHSPQAKGRVERLFRTLQDRLINEMRLRKISTLEGANSYLDTFIEEFNSKFSVEAKSAELAYRPLTKSLDLKEIFCIKETRTIATGNVVNFDNNKYVIENDFLFRIRGRWVEIRIYQDSSVKFYLEGKELKVKKLEKYKRKAA